MKASEIRQKEYCRANQEWQLRNTLFTIVQ